MKTMAIRLDDEVADLLSLVAQLEGTSVIDQIRQAIETHLETKASAGDLAERAQGLLDDIDREAQARKAAIGTLFEQASKPAPKSTGGSRRRSEPEARVLGFRPIDRKAGNQ
jgi:predicted transcriptional regulator